MGRLFLLMFIVTAVEIYLLIKIGGVIGAVPTVLLIFVTAGIGSWQLRAQGLSVLNKMQTLQEEPSKTLLEGLVLLVCAILLITPGILTDIVGLLGLIPAVRERIVAKMVKHSQVFTRQMGGGSSFFYYQSGMQQPPTEQPDVFEGEFTEVESKSDNTPDNNLDKKD